jgi:hypothetical protein
MMGWDCMGFSNEPEGAFASEWASRLFYDEYANAKYVISSVLTSCSAVRVAA